MSAWPRLGLFVLAPLCAIGPARATLAQAPAEGAPADAEARALLGRGDAALAEGRMEEARAAFAAAVHLSPDDLEAWYKLGYLEALMGRYEAAAEAFQAVLERDPDDAAARHNLETARRRMAEAADRGPSEASAAPPAAPGAPAGNARAAYERGVALVQQRRYREAVQHLDEALALRPDLAVAWVARGSARVGLRQYREAVDDYQRALELQPGLAAPLFGLGEAWRALGDPGRAAAWYRRYAESGAADADARLQADARRWAARLR